MTSKDVKEDQCAIMTSVDVMYVGGLAWQDKWLSLGTRGSLSGNMCYFWALLESFWAQF